MLDEWYDRQYQKPPVPQVHEKVPPDKPLLYDNKGRPLVREQPKVGFRPPKGQDRG
jgi:hypothetical protein